MRGLTERYAVVIVVLFTLIARGVCTLPVAAQADASHAPQFAIFPIGSHASPWFDVTVGAGSTFDLVAGVKLSSDDPVQLRAYAANAVNPPNGGFSAMSEDDEATGATRWLDFPARTLDLAPGEQIELPLTVAVPEDTPPGEYVTSLVVQTSEAVDIPGTEAFRQVLRSSVSVEITVPGEMTSGFELGEPVVLDGSLDVPIANTGTARVRPAGELIVVDMKGAVVSTTRVQMGSVYGGNDTVVRVSLPAKLAPGAYVVSIELTDEATGASDTVDATVAVTDDQVTGGVSVEAVLEPHGDPPEYGNVAVTIRNDGPAIEQAQVALVALLNGNIVETYQLVDRVPLPTGETKIQERYVPPDGWTWGTWTFRVEIVVIDERAETGIATASIGRTVVVK
jgi:hypothetical protein